MTKPYLYDRIYVYICVKEEVYPFGVHSQMMKKELLSIILSASLVVSSLATGVFAAPAIAGSHESSMEYVPVPEVETGKEITEEDAHLLSGGPALVTVADSSLESNSEFGQPEIWEGASLFADLEGEGTEESPYLIGSAEDLMLFANNINHGVDTSAHYRLTGNIDLGGEEWTPIGYVAASNDFSRSFSGVFDGNGYTVSNFKITKVDKDDAHIGFFGHMCAGTIKNLNIDNAVIDFVSSSTQKLYVGIIAGRVLTVAAGTTATITNCNVTGSSIKAKTDGTIYAGALAGTVIAGMIEDDSALGNEPSNVFLAFIDAECDIDISSFAKTNYFNSILGKYEKQVVAVGGLSGFLSAETNSILTIVNSSINGNVVANAENTLTTQAMAGGAFGHVKTFVDDNIPGGRLTINSCSSQGTVSAISNFHPYVTGGFAGQIYATANLFVNDCYSSADASGKFIQAGSGDGSDPTAGGFVGQIYFPNYKKDYGKTIKRCFGNGDAVDLTHTETTPKDMSFVGGFTGYSQVGIFEDCFRFEAQNVWGSDIIDYPDIICLSESDSKLLDKYTGFDFSLIWKMNPEADYFYPTLRKKIGYVNFVSDGAIFATAAFGTDGRVPEPEAEPTKDSTVAESFKFNYWSLSEDGSIFNFGGDTLSENTTLYAVFKSSPRQYKLTFINEGSAFSTSTLNYGSSASLPLTAPEKADTEQYYYVFLHWSETENGSAFDFSKYSVEGNKNFYAVYNEIDKSAWTGGVAEEFSSGFGTEALPYLIKTSDEFALFAKVINEQQDDYKNAYYALDANINLGGNYWLPIGNSFNAPFSAHFDGNGFTVSNYIVTNNQFVGLFGYVNNGTIKNLSLADFTIDLDITLDKNKYTSEINSNGVEYYAVYVGGLAGRADAKRGLSEISGIRVSNAVFKINANFAKNYIYAGNIIGYGVSYAVGELYIHDCFATTDITSVNTTGYSYVGGIAGRFDLASLGSSLMSRCYYVGSISSTSYNSSYAGGLVGYLFSFGNFIEAKSDDENAELSADDEDIMIENSFAVARIYANSTGYRSLAGAVVGEKNNFCSVKNVYYPDARVFVDPEPDREVVGTKISLSSILDKEELSKKCGFDFENVWTYISGYEYPVLLSMVADKEVFKVISSSLTGGTLNASLQVFSKTEQYTVVFCVYNSRNQVIGIYRENYTGAAVPRISIENVDKASHYSVSVIDKASLSPLFENIKVEL